MRTGAIRLKISFCTIKRLDHSILDRELLELKEDLVLLKYNLKRLSYPYPSYCKSFKLCVIKCKHQGTKADCE